MKPPRLPREGVKAKVVLLLRHEPRKLWTPKAIAREIGHPASSVRSALSRLLDETPDDRYPPVVRMANGYYRAFIDEQQLEKIEAPDLQLHGIQLLSRTGRNRGYSPPRPAEPQWGSIHSRHEWTRQDSSGQWVRDFAWGGRPVFVSVVESTGTVQVSLRAHAEPLSPRDFDRFATWLDGWLAAQHIVWVDPEVSSVEMHRDYSELTIDGVKRVRLKKWRNAWAQVYAKSQRLLRREVRFSSVHDEVLKVEELTAILESLTGPRRESVQMSGEADVPPPDPYSPEVA